MIELNKVGIEIDGKVYQMYKMNFGFQRRLIELQTELNKKTNSLAKKYNIDIEEIDTCEKISSQEKLEIAAEGLKVQEALTCLFVNKDEANILDNFDMKNVTELISALQ